MKYIVFDRQGQLVPVIFPELLNHREVAEALKSRISLSRSTVRSAGFVKLTAHETHGGSSTLEVESEPDDTLVIEHYSERVPEMISLEKAANVLAGAIGAGRFLAGTAKNGDTLVDEQLLQQCRETLRGVL